MEVQTTGQMLHGLLTWMWGAGLLGCAILITYAVFEILAMLKTILRMNGWGGK